MFEYIKSLLVNVTNLCNDLVTLIVGLNTVGCVFYYFIIKPIMKLVKKIADR